MAGEITPLKALMGWRRYVKLVADAVKLVAPEARVLVIGGAAENRPTARSDVDVLIALPKKPSFSEAVEVRAKVLEAAEELGLPPHAPIELHIVGEKELEEYAKRGKAIPADEL